MAEQDVAEFIPRVRRALEGPVPTGVALDDQVVLAMAADAIADVILFTNGQWGHSLVVTDRDVTTNVPIAWAVDPELSLAEESMIAYQAALTFFFHYFRDLKTSERMKNEGQEWEYTLSANVVRDQIALLKDARDLALASLKAVNPVLARYSSILQVRDRVASAWLEPWVPLSDGGGVELVP